MKRGEIIELKIDGLSPDGRGQAVHEGRTMTVRGAVPGDVVRARVASLKRNSARLMLDTIIEAGTARCDPECTHFGVCGGCSWQTIPYGKQCDCKARLVADALAAVPGLEWEGDIIVEPSPDLFMYRNKMEYSFDSPPSAEGRVYLGLHELGKFDRVFDLDRCHLQSEVSNRVVHTLRRFTVDHGLTAFGLKSHVGLLRYLVIRDGKNTGDLMVNLVTSAEPFPYSDDLVCALDGEVGGISTVLHTINRGTGSVATGDESQVLSGDGVIADVIGDNEFTISPEAFFQTNTHQAVNLYDAIRDMCGFDGTQRVLDLYCGTGTIGIHCANACGSVTGIEIVEDAVVDARRNAERNGVDNCVFKAGRVEKLVGDEDGDWDVVITDPPRAGMHPRALLWLAEVRPPRIVYVSCSVKIMPRDLETFALAGYSVKGVRAFDMSPHTPHVETVVLLERG